MVFDRDPEMVYPIQELEHDPGNVPPLAFEEEEEPESETPESTEEPEDE